MNNDFNFTNFLLNTVQDAFDITDDIWLDFINKLENVKSNAYSTILMAGLTRFIFNSLNLVEQMYGTETKNLFKEQLIEFLTKSPNLMSEDNESRD